MTLLGLRRIGGKSLRSQAVRVVRGLPMGYRFPILLGLLRRSQQMGYRLAICSMPRFRSHAALIHCGEKTLV
jgi:hypothetical protein